MTTETREATDKSTPRQPEPNDHRVHVQMPGEMLHGVRVAAIRESAKASRFVSVAEYIRRAIAEKLDRDPRA